jgi:hypothetical protein
VHVIRIAPAALLAVLALSACSTTQTSSVSSSFTGTSHDVAQAVVNFQSDANGGNDTSICSNDLSSGLLSKLQQSAPGQSCTTTVHNQLGEIDDYTLTVQSIKVNGTSATAVVKDVRAGKTHYDTLRLLKQGTVWKISGLA